MANYLLTHQRNNITLKKIVWNVANEAEARRSALINQNVTPDSIQFIVPLPDDLGHAARDVFKATAA